MKGQNSLKLAVLLLIGCNLQASYSSYDCCGPLEPRGWYVMPKAGAAPGFLINRGHEYQVNPYSGVHCPIVTTSATTVPCASILDAPRDVFQQSCCKTPKFSELFSQGVLHVGGEVGYVTDCHSMYFVDLIYNRAKGNCVSLRNRFVRASDSCCNNDCQDCSDPLVEYQRTDRYNNYSAFGAYVGNRYFFNRMWCDRLAFFLGLKVGILHRQKVCVNSTIPAQTSPTVFAESSFAAVAICRSNSVSGGVQVGFDYSINHCLALMVGIEVVASSAFRTNKNVAVADTSGFDVVTRANPTNIVWGNTGTFLQIPVWAGLRWEWDWCGDNACK